LRKVHVAILPLLSIVLVSGGCSRVETVKVINRFAQPIRVRLNGADTNPLIPARGEAVLDGKFYIGGRGVRVTVLTAQGRLLKKEDAIDVPGDSQFRRFAVVEVRP
jgi:hypothetical protein